MRRRVRARGRRRFAGCLPRARARPRDARGSAENCWRWASSVAMVVLVRAAGFAARTGSGWVSSIGRRGRRGRVGGSRTRGRWGRNWSLGESPWLEGCSSTNADERPAKSLQLVPLDEMAMRKVAAHSGRGGVWPGHAQVDLGGREHAEGRGDEVDPQRGVHVREDG